MSIKLTFKEVRNIPYDISNYLMHRNGYKYIDKYQTSSGKWVYVYTDRANHVNIRANRNLARVSAKNYNYEKETADWASSRAKERKDRGLSSDGSLERSAASATARANAHKDTLDYYNSEMDKAINDNSVKTQLKNKADNIKSKIDVASKKVKDVSSKVINNGKSIVDKIFKKEAVPTPTLSDPNGKTITENIITENKITETKIPEKKITETKTTEKKTTVSGTNKVKDISSKAINNGKSIVNKLFKKK